MKLKAVGHNLSISTKSSHRALFRTLSNIYDGFFLRVKLMAKRRELFFDKSPS